MRFDTKAERLEDKDLAGGLPAEGDSKWGHLFPVSFRQVHRACYSSCRVLALCEFIPFSFQHTRCPPLS